MPVRLPVRVQFRMRLPLPVQVRVPMPMRGQDADMGAKSGADASDQAYALSCRRALVRCCRGVSPSIL